MLDVGAASGRASGGVEIIRLGGMGKKTVKAAEEEGALTIYMTQAFEPVFREAFQKTFPKIKVSTVVGRGFQLGQRVMSERRADKQLVDFVITGNITPVTVFHKAKILDPIKPLLPVMSARFMRTMAS